MSITNDLYILNDKGTFERIVNYKQIDEETMKVNNKYYNIKKMEIFKKHNENNNLIMVKGNFW